MKRTLILTVIVIAIVAGRAMADPMSSANYTIPASVVASGGGAASSSQYQMVATIGESAIGPTATPNYSVYAGFLAALLASQPMLGDINGDGLVDAKDVQMLLQIAGGIRKATDGQPSNGDVTGDGQIGLNDAAKALRYLNGLQPTLP